MDIDILLLLGAGDEMFGGTSFLAAHSNDIQHSGFAKQWEQIGLHGIHIWSLDLMSTGTYPNTHKIWFWLFGILLQWNPWSWLITNYFKDQDQAGVQVLSVWLQAWKEIQQHSCVTRCVLNIYTQPAVVTFQLFNARKVIGGAGESRHCKRKAVAALMLRIIPQPSELT